MKNVTASLTVTVEILTLMGLSRREEASPGAVRPAFPPDPEHLKKAAKEPLGLEEFFQLIFRGPLPSWQPAPAPNGINF
jgi:hypothetical protein